MSGSVGGTARRDASTDGLRTRAGDHHLAQRRAEADTELALNRAVNGRHIRRA